MNAPVRTIPAPQPNAETQAYWDAARQGTLLIRRCEACGEAHFYPRSICPFCFSHRTVWQPACGRGRIYSFSVTRRVPAPWAIAYVTLEEGVTMMTNIVDCDFDELAVDAPVTLVFKPSDGGPPVPMFTLEEHPS